MLPDEVTVTVGRLLASETLYLHTLIVLPALYRHVAGLEEKDVADGAGAVDQLVATDYLEMNNWHVIPFLGEAKRGEGESPLDYLAADLASFSSSAFALAV